MHRAQQHHCCAVCKISKWFHNRKEIYRFASKMCFAWIFCIVTSDLPPGYNQWDGQGEISHEACCPWWDLLRFQPMKEDVVYVCILFCHWLRPCTICNTFSHWLRSCSNIACCFIGLSTNSVWSQMVCTKHWGRAYEREREREIKFIGLWEKKLIMNLILKWGVDVSWTGDKPLNGYPSAH